MTRGAIRPTSHAEAVERARSMLGYVPAPHPETPAGYPVGPIQYRLKPGHNGGDDPYAPHPASWSYGHRTPTCDCVGLVMWAWGLDRMQPERSKIYAQGWLNTNSLIASAEAGEGIVEQIDAPELGCAVVYPSRGDTMGHIGIVTGLPAEMCWEDLTVIDCAASHSRRHKRAQLLLDRLPPGVPPGPELRRELSLGAIRERSGALWARHGVMLRRVVGVP